MSELEAREIKEDEVDSWDRLVHESGQGSLFSTSLWMDVLNMYPGGKARILGIFSSDEIIGGILLYERKKAFLNIMAYPPLTPFTSIILKQATSSRFSKIEGSQKKIIHAISGCLSKYNFAALQLHPSIKDIRPLLWMGWRSSAAYTYEIDLSDIGQLWSRIGKDAKYEISKAESSGIEIAEDGDIEEFLVLYEKTFSKQNLNAPLNLEFIKKMYKFLKSKNRCRLYVAYKENAALSAALVVWDGKKAYYLLAASEPDSKLGTNYMLLWHIIKHIPENLKALDFVGANIPNIAKFKREFATNLVNYHIVEKYSSFFVRILHNLYRKL